MWSLRVAENEISILEENKKVGLRGGDSCLSGKNSEGTEKKTKHTVRELPKHSCEFPVSHREYVKVEFVEREGSLTSQPANARRGSGLSPIFKTGGLEVIRAIFQGSSP